MAKRCNFYMNEGCLPATGLMAELFALENSLRQDHIVFVDKTKQGKIVFGTDNMFMMVTPEEAGTLVDLVKIPFAVHREKILNPYEPAWRKVFKDVWGNAPKIGAEIKKRIPRNPAEKEAYGLFFPDRDEPEDHFFVYSMEYDTEEIGSTVDGELVPQKVCEEIMIRGKRVDWLYSKGYKIYYNTVSKLHAQVISKDGTSFDGVVMPLKY